MKSKKNILIIILAIALISLGPFLYFYYNFRVNKALNLIMVPYANQTIQEDTEITSESISYMYVPKSSLLGEYFSDPEEIIGKCSKDNSIITIGSIYYKDLITTCK